MRLMCRCISSTATVATSTRSGQSFRDFLRGELPALPGEQPTLSDWADHLTTIFPEVRLKKFLEMRGADGGPWRRICALPAFWVGLLYDGASLDAAWELAATGLRRSGTPCGTTPRDMGFGRRFGGGRCGTWRATCWRSRRPG